MKIIQAIILGLIQGLTEFLPVSSSGHLILSKKVFGFDTESFGLTFDIALHLATLVAVFIVLRKDIGAILKKPFQKLTFFLIIATIPAALVGIFFDDYVESMASSGGFLGIAFLFTAIILIFAERRKKNGSKKNLDNMNMFDSFAIGASQAVAIMPGISRSGSTFSMGTYVGLKKDAALRFSFLLSIPVILGSVVLGVKDIVETSQAVNWGCLIAGMLSAGISGYISVKFMLDFFPKRKLYIFAIYLIILGVFVLLDQLVFHRFFDTFLVWIYIH